MRFPRPEISLQADAELDGLGFALEKMVRYWLNHHLAQGRVDDIRPFDDVRNDPPWQRAIFSPNVNIIFRALTEEERQERGGDEAPLFLVGHVVDPADRKALVAKMLAESQEEEEREEKEEEERKQLEAEGKQ